ncbi:cutinase-domain-containing protein [Bisporella sp. PMI_857]|nr:cutinase-domain-containing protein [Bisporella sp. PMI_857]
MGVSNTANDWVEIIAGKAPCKSLAVIFAKGTFDSGNLGVWVGPQFFSPIKAKVKDAAFQGVDEKKYLADLPGYLLQGGSNDGAESMAKMVDAYAAKCKDSHIVVSGWSQGALVAHKALAQISKTTEKQIAGFVTFGDPNHVWEKTPLPKYIDGKTEFFSPCVKGSLPDLLCAELPTDFKFPTGPSDLIEAFNDLPSIAEGAQQAAAAASLVKGFPGQLAKTMCEFAKSMTIGKALSCVNPLSPEGAGLFKLKDLMKLGLTPQHFTYGNNKNYAEKAAAFVVDLPALKKSKTADAGTQTEPEKKTEKASDNMKDITASKTADKTTKMSPKPELKKSKTA